MRKASRILFLVAGILSIVAAVTLLIIGIVCAVMGSPAMVDAIREGIKNGSIVVKGSSSDIELAIQIYQSTMLSTAVTMFVFMAFNIVNIVFSFIARKKQSKGVLILNIVFGALSCVEVNLVGGILGLIANARQPKEVK